MNVYGVFLSEDEMKERATWHETTYFEVEIPTQLENEISEFVTNKIKEFHKNCGCGLCKLEEDEN